MADQQKEEEGQLIYGMSFMGTFVHKHFSFYTFHYPFSHCVLSCYLIEFIEDVAITYFYTCLNSLKVSKIAVWDDDKFSLCDIG